MIFLMTSGQALAQDSTDKAYGYFSSLVDYIDDSSACAPDEVSFDIWLVNPNTKTPVSGSVGDWWYVDIRDNSDGSYLRTNWVGVDKNKSDRFCIDIDNEKIDIGVYDSPDYHYFGSVSVNFTEHTQESRDEMKGKHFRGYVELASFSETTPYVEALFPTHYVTSYLPDFQIRVNTISNIYNASTLRKAGVYFVNDDGSFKFQIDVDDYGGVGDRYVPFPTEVDDGWYYWTPLVQLDGYVETEKTSWPGYTWYTSETPFYGLVDLPYFGIDRTEPTATLNSITIATSTDNEVTVVVDHTAEDSMLGVATTTIYVIDVAASTTNAIEIAYDSNYIYSVNELVSITNLEKGKTYGFYSRTRDWLNQIFTTPTTYLTIPNNPTVIDPTSTNIATTSANLGATVDSDGGSPVIDRGTCFDVVDTFASEVCASEGSGLGVFSHFRGGMTENTTIYFRGYAENVAGIGYSTTSSFSTLGYGPIINNLGVDNLTMTDANLRADIVSKNGSEINQHGFCWNEGGSYNSSDPTHQCQLFGLGDEGQFNYSLSSLTADTTYSYIAVAENDSDATASGVFTFTTLKLPAVTIHPADNITGSSADLHATLDDDGNGPISRHGFCWNEGGSYNSLVAACPNLGSSISSGSGFGLTLNSLLPNTIYSFIAYAENAGGKYETGELQFTTTSLPPTVSLTADPSTVNDGYPVMLEWTSVDADSCSSPDFNTGGNTSGYVSVTPSGDTTYNITCSGSGGDTPDSVDVTVNYGPLILVDPELEMTVRPNVVRAGDSVNLEWKINNVPQPLDCEITGPTGLASDPQASFSHTPQPSPVTESTGVVTSGPLFAEQTFTFTCVDAITPTETYSTSTEVMVVGGAYET